MNRFLAFVTFFLFLAYLPGCGKNDNPPDPNPSVGKREEPLKKLAAPKGGPTPFRILDLAGFLKSKGYIEVPLVLTKEGFLDVEVKINGQPLLFILDTGAGTTVIDKAVAGRLKLPEKKTDEKLSGITGAEALLRTGTVQVSIGSNQCQSDPILSDLCAINAGRKSFGTGPCDGILGQNDMQIFGAVIDHSAAKLFLLDGGTIFEMPGGLTTKSSLNISIKEGRVSREIAVEIVDKEPPVVTKTGIEQLKAGMTLAQISAVLGGDLKKGRMSPSYTGTMAVVQGKSRIDLTFQDGKGNDHVSPGD